MADPAASFDPNAPCPCGSGATLAACCGPRLDGSALAPDAEALMRSRYTAFVLRQDDYIAATWHPDYRPGDPGGPGTRWLGLQVIAAEAGQATARVEFEARYLDGGRVEAIHERSDFVFENNRWWYTRGAMLPPTFQPWKPARNEACPCGSGAKFKRCCGGGSNP